MGLSHGGARIGTVAEECVGNHLYSSQPPIELGARAAAQRSLIKSSDRIHRSSLED